MRYALRLVHKTPGFTATALVTLALCLGANLAIFAVVDSVLVRPLPFPTSDRLVRVFNTYPQAGVPDDGCSVANYYERRGHLAAFTSLAAYRETTAILGEKGSTEREQVTRVTPDFFSTLSLGPVVGRAFTDEETTYQTDGVAILTDGYWRQRLGADLDVIGRKIRVDGLEVEVVGVLPPEWTFLSSKSRLYLPYSSNPEDREPARRHSGSSSHMIARLAPGATFALAQSQLDAHNAGMAAADPDAKMMADAGFRSVVVPLHADHVAAIRPTLLLLQAGALFLLLLGAVNLVNLLLIRASSRVKELAVRQAMGARRGHIVGEVMVETTLLTLVGGLLGLAVGAAGIRLLAVLGADHLPLGAHIAFDARLTTSHVAIGREAARLASACSRAPRKGGMPRPSPSSGWWARRSKPRSPTTRLKAPSTIPSGTAPTGLSSWSHARACPRHPLASPCKTSSERSTPSCRSTTFVRWKPVLPTASSRVARQLCSPVSSRAWRYSWPPSVPTGSSASPWRSGVARSPCAWPSARGRSRSVASSSPWASSCWPRARSWGSSEPC